MKELDKSHLAILSLHYARSCQSLYPCRQTGGIHNSSTVTAVHREKLKNTDDLLRQVIIKNLKRRADNIINDFNTSESNQNADAILTGIVKYTFEAEDEDEFHLVKNICYCRQSKAS